MGLTRKDFRSAARQLSEWSDDKLFTKEDVVYEFVKFLQQTNSNFDSSRFIKACREGERKRDAEGERKRDAEGERKRDAHPGDGQ